VIRDLPVGKFLRKGVIRGGGKFNDFLLFSMDGLG